MATITCKIPEKLNADLDALSVRHRVSKSAIIRQALEERLRRTRRRPAATAFELAKSLCGVLHGPSDLSTHPRHMEGFGA